MNPTPHVAFTGPRNLQLRFYPMVKMVTEAVIASRRRVVVGCAWGLDNMVRRACEVNEHDFKLFAVKESCPACKGQFLQSGNAEDGEPPGYCPVCIGTGCRYGSGKGAFVNRSVAMVKFLTGTDKGRGLIGFPDRPCPSGIYPSQDWTSGENPSGTWSTIALAIGLNIPVVLFPCMDLDADQEVLYESIASWCLDWQPAGKNQPWNYGRIGKA